YFTRSVTFFAVTLETYFLADLPGEYVTLIVYLPFLSLGRRTVTLPLAFEVSFAFTVFLPYFTVMVPVALDRPAALTRTTIFARLFAFTAFAETVTLGLPLATLFADDDATPGARPAT